MPHEGQVTLRYKRDQDSWQSAEWGRSLRRQTAPGKWIAVGLCGCASPKLVSNDSRRVVHSNVWIENQKIVLGHRDVDQDINAFKPTIH